MISTAFSVSRSVVSPVALLILLSASGPPAFAEVGPPSHLRRSLELSLGTETLGWSTVDHEYSFIARYVHRFPQRWGFEVSASEHRHRRSHVRGDGSSLELSLRRSLFRNDKVDLFLLGGPGWAEQDVESSYPLTQNGGEIVHYRLSEDSLSAHLGFGAEFSLGDRWLLRTEVRDRIFEDLEATFFEREFAVGFGWRF